MESFAAPPESLFDFSDWHLARGRAEPAPAGIAEWRAHGAGYVVRLTGVATRDAAARLTGSIVLVERDALEELGEDEHYWADLVGLEVWNLDGVRLGCIDHFIDAPANAVMVVIGEREHLVPLTPQHLRRVDAGARRVEVDWPADF